ncbi:MAG TPA: DUF4185 domain-containing protein [Nocardioides sp.]|nr:DUF4185 domain-containing protein [Nocardioides sp.]
MTAAPSLGSWRLRVVGVVVPVGALLLGLALLVPGAAPTPSVVDAPGATRTACLDTSTVDDVPELDRFVRSVRGSDAFAGGDVGASTRLQDGRQVFVFGDTLRAADFEGQRFVRNSMLVASPRCVSVVLPADRGAVVPDRRDGVGYWPMSIARVARPGYDLVGVALQRVRATDDPAAGVFAFEILGPALAVFVVPVGGVPQLVSRTDLGADRVATTRPMWGAASAVAGDWVYLYGTARPDHATTGGFSLRVARVRPEQVQDQRRWRYWTGSRWQSDPARSAELIGSSGGVSQTLSVFEQDGTWYALSKRDEVLGRDLAIWTAPAPTGPFRLAARPLAIPSSAATGTLRYLPLAHPELFPRPGTVVVSYSQNNTDFQTVLDDPRRYRPRFLRVRLPAPTR